MNITFINRKGEEEVTQRNFHINLGPGGGCMQYRDEKPICQRAFFFKPSIEYLHLPSNQTLTEKFPNSTFVLINHVTLGFIVLSLIFFWVAPFVPGFYDRSAFTMMLGFISCLLLMVIGNASATLDLKHRLKGTIPEMKVKLEDGYGYMFFLLLMSSISMVAPAIVADGIKREPPPQETDDSVV
ncbi:uncharacterized protein I206_102484 [Kwoniella pini CBS 10737]|uniref:Uncharacterized protein n=1 Tax=Kwoniella pini CBS 10737 TaxID=1296096 RepID=A0A1B9I5H7_9TREE|nr:uncharacterized protein I206_02835 [Kwoniella pini CBS 10737]OCF50779.1 hypothetical protein I206_02835 [Kwoniella pini CBS 10737]